MVIAARACCCGGDEDVDDEDEDGNTGIRCGYLASPWFTPVCPKGWLVFTIQYQLCQRDGAGACTSNASCPDTAQEFLLAYNGTNWVRPSTGSGSGFSVEERDNMDGTFSYRLSTFTAGGSLYSLDGGDELIHMSGDCCVKSWSVATVATRRIWDVEDDHSLTITATGIVDQSTSINCNGFDYAHSPKCAEINNRSWTLDFVGLGSPFDGYYLKGLFTDPPDTVVTGATFGGHCENAFDTADCNDYSTINSTHWGAQHVVRFDAFGDVAYGLATYADMYASPVYIKLATGCEFCCYRMSGESNSITAAIDCTESDKNVLDPIESGEWVTTAGYVDICNNSAATLVVVE